MASGVPTYLPGFEPENIQRLLTPFCAELDNKFPDKVIVWSEWDHDRMDKAADYLTKSLGYAGGREFLEAYGYTIVQNRNEIPTDGDIIHKIPKTYCPNCGAEINGTQKFCMSCGAPLGNNSHPITAPEPVKKGKNAKKATKGKNEINAQQTPASAVPKAKKKRHPFLTVIIVLLIIGFFATRGGSNSTSSSNSTVKSSSGTTTTKTDKTPAPEATPIAYTEVEITTLFSELKNNALSAKEKYKGMYVSVRGRLSNVDASGKYIGISAEKDNYDYILDSVQCYIKSDDVKNAVMALRTDDLVTVKGKITSIGEVLGYSLDITEIEIPETRRNVSGGTNSVSTTAGEYTPVEITTLFDDLDGNALLAKSTYKGAYVSVRGRLSNIDASGKYISIGADKNDYDHLFNSIMCYIKTEDIKKSVMNMTIDSWIVVKGKITDVGEVLGYSMDIVEFG